MKEIKKYISFDGKEFDNHYECLNYENAQALSSHATFSTAEMKDFIDSFPEYDDKTEFIETYKERAENVLKGFVLYCYEKKTIMGKGW